MGTVAELEKVRKKRNRGRFMQRLMVLMLMIIVALGSLYVLQGGILRVAAGRVADGMMAFLAGETLPATLSMNRPQWAADVAGRIAIADNTTLAIYSRAGRQVASHVVGFQRPAFRAAGGRVLAYDVGGSRFDLYYWSEKTLSRDMGEAIYCADLAPGGNVAVGSSAASALSGVTVFSEKNVELFRWSSSELMVSAVALDAGGTRIAFAGLSTEKGEVYSSVNLYKIDQEEPVMRVLLPGEVVVAIGHSGHDVVVVSDQRVTLIDEKGQVKGQYDYTLSPVAFAIAEKGQVGVVTGDYSDGHALKVTLIASDMKVQGEWSLDGDVAQIGFSGNQLFVVAGEHYTLFSSGKEAVTARLPEGILAIPGKEVFYVTPSQLKKTAIT